MTSIFAKSFNVIIKSDFVVYSNTQNQGRHHSGCWRLPPPHHPPNNFGVGTSPAGKIYITSSAYSLSTIII